jgi:hypothetical protein
MSLYTQMIKDSLQSLVNVRGIIQFKCNSGMNDCFYAWEYHFMPLI